MVGPTDERRTHWQNIYRTKSPDSVSWYRPRLEVSLELLSSAGLSAQSRLIDVGGGASTLVDDLLDRGLRDVSVLDVAEEALSVARQRLGERAKAVRWYAGDVLEIALPSGAFDFWHDRAALHFLRRPADATRYAHIAARAVAIGGYAVVAGFAPDGPRRCSGLPVARRSPEDIEALFAPAFVLVRTRAERHRTPAGIEQSFAYQLLQRVRGSRRPRSR
ncbi:MAG: class I SAM-dependent methyltransferase [Gammaproteobacteria bacterium]|nr:class I SAM-dependent methyltransferase [Gammaproteobacteria bacterium]